MTVRVVYFCHLLATTCLTKCNCYFKEHQPVRLENWSSPIGIEILELLIEHVLDADRNQPVPFRHPVSDHRVGEPKRVASLDTGSNWLIQGLERSTLVPVSDRHVCDES